MWFLFCLLLLLLISLSTRDSTMSVVLRGPIGRQSRPTVRERLAKLRGMDETSTEMQLFLKEVEEVAKKDADVMGFRWHCKFLQIFMSLS